MQFTVVHCLVPDSDGALRGESFDSIESLRAAMRVAFPGRAMATTIVDDGRTLLGLVLGRELGIDAALIADRFRLGSVPIDGLFVVQGPPAQLRSTIREAWPHTWQTMLSVQLDLSVEIIAMLRRIPGFSMN